LPWFVDAFGEWYPLLYPHRDDAEAARLIAALDRAVAWRGCRVLDVGCGAGRHLRHLRDHGAGPTGLDLSPWLLREALVARREAAGSWPLVRADMRRLPFAAESFHIVTSFFTSFGYFEESEDDAVIEEVARVLRPGGTYVLDLLNRALVIERPPGNGERSERGFRIREARRLEGEGRRIVKRVDVTRTADDAVVASYEERVTLYDPEEIRAKLAGHGLAAVAEWGDYAGTPFEPRRSARHLVVSRRKR
jgi:SAM-dependent methyltransferase